jgi:predicted nuclease of predicted toxin-antitoxin system
LAAETRIAIYMDEHVPTVVSESLRRRGVDVLTAQEAAMRGASDEEQLALAVREGRTIFTQDADFLRMHAAGHPHRGMVYAPQVTPIATIVRGLMLIAEVLSPEDMVGCVEFL